MCVGGRVLIERYGFQTTFLITACIKTASFIPLLVLLCVLKEGPQGTSWLPLWCRRRPVNALEDDDTEAIEDNTLQAPLLGRAGQQSGALHQTALHREE